MGKAKSIGICALCNDENIELKQSHIIPKLVYRRMKSSPKSQFRNLYNIKEIYRDGEKKPMLCIDCEGFFNKFETPYANHILDPFLKSAKLNRNLNKITNEYIYSLNWRILNDDLYAQNSQNSLRGVSADIFIEFESILKQHLLAVKEGRHTVMTREIKNHIFCLNDFNFGLEIETFCKAYAVGYCFDSLKNGRFIIITCYLGLVICTIYTPARFLYLDCNYFAFYKKEKIKNIICIELRKQIEDTVNELVKSKKILEESGDADKIRRRYEIQ